VVDMTTPDDACRAFGEFLGVGEAVPPAALRAALADPVYARKLVGSRGAPDAIRYLLARPPAHGDAPAHSDGELVAGAAKALARWVFAGLKRVDDAVYERRLAACRSCEHLAKPTGSVLYALAGAGDERTCGLCGCVAAKKAALPTEACPAMDAARPGYTRWGEPMG
jgi:hypothetical protein